MKKFILLLLFGFTFIGVQAQINPADNVTYQYEVSQDVGDVQIQQLLDNVNSYLDNSTGVQFITSPNSPNKILLTYDTQQLINVVNGLKDYNIQDISNYNHMLELTTKSFNLNTFYDDVKPDKPKSLGVDSYMGETSNSFIIPY